MEPNYLNLITFLITKGIISRAKLAKELGLTLSDFNSLYGELIEKELDKIYNID